MTAKQKGALFLIKLWTIRSNFKSFIVECKITHSFMTVLERRMDPRSRHGNDRRKEGVVVIY